MSAPPSPADASGLPAGRTAPLLEVRDLKVIFTIGGATFRSERSRVRAVDGISLRIDAGQTLGLVGESGCGKTTAGRAIVRLLDPTAGSIRFNGDEIARLGGEKLRRMRQHFQMIFQDPYSSLNPRMTVGDIVREPMDIHGIGSGKDRHERVGELLDVVGMSRLAAGRFPHEFSGGQRQRIGVARALALNPQLIVADEPISALDVSIRAQILNLLERLQDRLGLSYLVVAHDLAAVRHISDRVAVMYLGRIVETASAAELYRAPLHPYSVALLSAVPIPDPAVQKGRRRIILRGDIPSPINPPPGCAFHTRCWLFERLGRPERCVSESPDLRVLGSGHDTACHFAEQLDGSPEQLTATGRLRAGPGTPGAGAPEDAGSRTPPPPASTPGAGNA